MLYVRIQLKELPTKNHHDKCSHSIYYSGVKIYNNLPLYVKEPADDPTTFELKLKNFLYFHSYYSEEFFQHQF